MSDDTTAHSVQPGMLTVTLHNGFSAAVEGNLAALRVLSELVTPNREVAWMRIYEKDIREPHGRNGWIPYETWSYTRLSELREATQ